MRLDEPVERGDPDELTRIVDNLCSSRDWDGLVELRDRCRLALARGKQLWGVAAHCEYRLALEAPGRWAGAVVISGAGSFAFGPLPEVAASTHEWEELRDHVPTGPLHAVTAHERVVRGDDLADDDTVDRSVLDLPLALATWEPAYSVPTYKPDGIDVPSPDRPRPRGPMTLLPPGADEVVVDDPDAVRALTGLGEAWAAESDGRSTSVAVRGDAAVAVAALGPRHARLVEIDGPSAMAWMSWTAASGGAHGRRRGGAAGRFATWWTLASIGALLDDWPLAADELGELVEDLRFVAWDVGEPDTGWSLRLAIEDPAEGLAWAVAAVDSA